MLEVHPHENDVLLGRGPFINAHPGNQHFRYLVDCQLPKWVTGRNNHEKRAIAVLIFERITSLNPPGRFLVEDPSSACSLYSINSSNSNSSVTGFTAVPAPPVAEEDVTSTAGVAAEAAADPNKNITTELTRSHQQQRQDCGSGSFISSSTATTSSFSSSGSSSSVAAGIASSMSTTAISWYDVSDSRKNSRVRDTTTTTTSSDLVPGSSSTNGGATVHPALIKKSWIHVDSKKAIDKILKRLRERAQAERMMMMMKADEDKKGGQAAHTYFDDDDDDDDDDGASQRETNMMTNIFNSQSILPCNDDCAILDKHHFDFKAKNGDNARCSTEEFCKFLKYCGLDEQPFTLEEVTNVEEYDTQILYHEYTLRQWIMALKPKDIIEHNTDGTLSPLSDEYNEVNLPQSEQASYITSALLIALKLTECLLEAENDEQNGHGNPIPLASIAPENVLIRARQSNHAPQKGIIEFVWVMSCVGDESTTGTVFSRLFAVGIILYELFSTKEFTMDEDEISAGDNMVSMDSISFMNEAENAHRSQKRTNWKSTRADKEVSNFIARLESSGVPWSLCTLVKNLFDCRNSSFCKDDAYASFDDLQVDLQLMVDNPSCFLNNIHISNMPKLVMLDKLYGRDNEVRKLDELFQRHITGQNLNGAIISGEAGVGKSKLAEHIQKLTNQSNGYFLSAKFEQNQMSLKPLSTVIHEFDCLCEMVFNDCTHSQLTEIEKELKSALGSQPNLLGVVANLRKLMPSSFELKTSTSSCIDSAISTRYLLGELLRVISSYSKPITFVVDDIQYADQASLLLVGNMLFNARVSPVFFCLCHRDDETSMSVSFNAWLTSIKMFALEPIKVESLSSLGVNSLVSEALHLSPRLTRPLSSVLHHKTRGNPLFLRQLLDSLTDQGYVYVDLKQRTWAWDLDKIMELEISKSVLTLLTSDVQRLPSDLQFGLQVAACIGSCVTESMINYLSMDLGLNLIDILRQVSLKGFMIDVDDSKLFRFAHDQIQEAVYELMPEQQRRENHMRFGLALCTQTLDKSTEDEELFFAAVNQINQGGPTAVHEPRQKSVFAQLNLKAGRRSIESSDYNTAFMLFQHGISFLGDDDWTLNYQLSLDLYDAVAEAALILNKLSMVSMYMGRVVLHARCFDDKLRCLHLAARALSLANRVDDSIEASYAILIQFGETLPCAIEDEKLRIQIDQMDLPGDTICNLQENNEKRMTTLLSLYSHLAHIAHYHQPRLVGSLSLRMVEITMKTGLSAMSPLAFAYFGGVLVKVGRISEGCRLGKLAFTLVERRGSLHYKSRVILFVCSTVFWTSEPLQMLVEAHLIGHKAGLLSGDVHCSVINLLLSLLADYVAGQNLDTVQNNIRDFISKLQTHGVKLFFRMALLLLSQIMVLKEGLHMSSIPHVDHMPSERTLVAETSSLPTSIAQGKILQLARSYFFRRLDDASLNIDISGEIDKYSHQLNPHFLFGSFFEGLTSFLLARHSNDNIESEKLIERGHSVLTKMRCWSDHTQWNWENKMLLLEAESMFTRGEFNRAGSLYDKAIQSAREHKFIHEEAIASELAGNFYHERGFRQKSYSYLVHSVHCYEKWGAHAVATRVKTVMGDYFGGDIDQLGSCEDTSLEHIFASSQGSDKKRQYREQ